MTCLTVEKLGRFLSKITSSSLILSFHTKLVYSIELVAVKSRQVQLSQVEPDLDCSIAMMFPPWLIWNAWGGSQLGGFFYLFLAKVLTQDLPEKKERALGNRCFLRCQKEETIDHLLVHWAKDMML